MNQISEEVHQIFPCQDYLQFISKFSDKGTDEIFDPFALNLDYKNLDAVLVDRVEINAILEQPISLIILGRPGSGKTTLFRQLKYSNSNRQGILTVGIRLMSTHSPEGTGLLSPEHLSTEIFNAFWEQLKKKDSLILPAYRHYQDWMVELRWFYQRFHPRRPEIPDEFEMMTWLNANANNEPINHKISASDALLELIHFITSHSLSKGDAYAWPFERIELLIDEFESISQEGVNLVLERIPKWIMFSPETFQIKLFSETKLQSRIEDRLRSQIRHGRAAVYELPPWEAQYLEELFNNRLGLLFGSEQKMYIPESHLSRPAHETLLETITSEALKVYGLADELDAPIHLLQLTRGLLTACSGRWKKLGFDPPLNKKDLENIFFIYWDTQP